MLYSIIVFPYFLKVTLYYFQNIKSCIISLKIHYEDNINLLKKLHHCITITRGHLKGSKLTQF